MYEAKMEFSPGDVYNLLRGAMKANGFKIPEDDYGYEDRRPGECNVFGEPCPCDLPRGAEMAATIVDEHSTPVQRAIDFGVKAGLIQDIEFEEVPK